MTATWVLPQGWTQPIPVTQFNAQYPWMEVDEYGQIHLKADYREWLEQQGAAKDLAMNNPVNSGLGVPHPDGAQVPDGGVGWIPPTALNTVLGWEAHPVWVSPTLVMVCRRVLLPLSSKVYGLPSAGFWYCRRLSVLRFVVVARLLRIEPLVLHRNEHL